MATRSKKCQKCGSNMVTVDGRWECLICSNMPRTMGEARKFYQVNKEEILADLARLGRQATMKKWRIPPSTMAQLLQRWGITSPWPGAAAPAAPADNLVPGLPPWSNDWPEAVQLKWLEIFQGRLK